MRVSWCGAPYEASDLKNGCVLQGFHRTCTLPAMADPAKIEQFVAVTGVSEDAAKFYLDSSSGDVETAINQFYATGGVQEAPEASAEDFMDAPEESQPGKQGVSSHSSARHLPSKSGMAHTSQYPFPTIQMYTSLWLKPCKG